MFKMYCLIRSDLTHSYRACQAGHAIAQYFLDYGKHEVWDNGTMIYLKIKNEAQLKKWKEKLQNVGLNFSEFIEPDLGNQLTAISCIDKGDIFQKLSLL